MTHDEPTTDSSVSEEGPRIAVSTEDRLQDALRRVVLEAESNGVDVCGGWHVVGDGKEWDLEITRVVRR